MNKLVFIALLSLISFNSTAQTNQLRVSSNNRYIENSDGSPFIWIGDTAWELFHKLNRKDAEKYLRTRAKQGFTVIQAVILAEDDGLRKPNAYGEIPLLNQDPEKPNEKYFEHVDFILNKAKQLGLYIALLPTWGDKVYSERKGIGPEVFNESNAFSFGKFLGNRYKDKPIIWVLGGDRNIYNKAALSVWRAMAKGIKKGDGGKNLMSYHPAGEQSSSQYKEDWIDFNMFQSGHASKYMPIFRFAETDYNSVPTKPFLDAEPAYEDIPVKFWEYINWNDTQKVPKSILNKNNTIKNTGYFKKGFFNDHDVRVHAYWGFLSGSCGYTYGHNSVWQMFSNNGDFTIPALLSWKKALKRPGAKSITHLHKFLKNIPSQLVPDQAIILTKFAKDSTYISAATTADHSLTAVYLAKGQKVKLSLHHFKSDLVSCTWYNPKTGKYTNSFVNTSGQDLEFSPPKSGINKDWLLVLKAIE